MIIHIMNTLFIQLSQPKMYCYKSIVRLPNCESIDSPLILLFSYYNDIDLTPIINDIFN